LTAVRPDAPLAVALDWIEAHCIVPDGFRKGSPFELYDYQFLYLANFYRVRGDAPWVPENPVLAPAFVYRRGLLVGPQKVGKNPLIAAQVCLEGVGPALFAGFAGRDEGYACSDHGCRCGWEYPYEAGEPRGMAWSTPLIQITAFSEDSTENTYDALRPMIDDGPLHDLIPKTGEAFIRLPGGGRIDTVTSSNQSRLGQRVTFVPQDELGLWTAANKMVKLADTQYRGLSGMGGRASLTTNAWDPSESSVAQLQYESSAPDVYRQMASPPKNLSYANKAERRKIHRLVYPADTLRPSGHIDLDSIEAEAADLAERDLAQAARFYGNIIVPGAGHAVDPATWSGLARPGLPAANEPIGLGFAGGALRGCTRDGFSFDLTNGAESRADVIEAVAAAFRTYRVGRMFADKRKWYTEVENWTAAYGKDPDGKPVVLVLDPDQPVRFAPAFDRWDGAVGGGIHTHDGDPVLTSQLATAQRRKVRLAEAENDRTMYVLVRGTDRLPIDHPVADVLAYEAAMTMTEVLVTESVYESRGVSFV
jgi:hypothetical protein